jgi:transposase-like protein
MMINTREIAKEYRLSHWAQVMQERAASGKSIKEFCKHIGICGNTYFYWQRRLREAACEHLNTTQPASRTCGKASKAERPQKPVAAPNFAEVIVYEAPAPLAQEDSTPQLRIEISGVKITADSSYPIDKLAAIIREFVGPC